MNLVFKECPKHGPHTGARCPRCEESARGTQTADKTASNIATKPTIQQFKCQNLTINGQNCTQDSGTEKRQSLGLADKDAQKMVGEWMEIVKPSPFRYRHRFTVTGNPIGKPRMTQRDKWKKRPCVLRYREWADRAREAAGVMLPSPGTLNWTAYLPIPKSWSKIKRDLAKGQPHRQKPDRDNIDKSILDALFSQDCGIYAGTTKKLWDDGNGPRIEIEILQ